jgi:hypothetical protein
MSAAIDIEIRAGAAKVTNSGGSAADLLRELQDIASDPARAHLLLSPLLLDISEAADDQVVVCGPIRYMHNNLFADCEEPEFYTISLEAHELASRVNREVAYSMRGERGKP